MAADIEFNVRNGMTVGANKHLVLDVNGALSGSDITCTTGRILSGGSDLLDVFGSSDVATTVASNSGNWQDTYTHVQSVSDTWGGADGYTTNIGDGSTTSIDVAHNLNTTNLTYSLINNDTNEFTSTKTVVVDSNTVKFVFTTAPTLNKFKVVIISTDGTGSGSSGGSGGSNTQASYNVYSTSTLPLFGSPGETALISDGSDTNGPAMAYFYQGKWYRTLDNVLLKDQIVDLYILAGQSNAIGQGAVSELTQSQSTADALFWRSYHDNQNSAQSTQRFQDTWSQSIVAGETGGNDASRFGPEIGFADYMESSATRPFGIIKYAVGSTALTKDYDPDNSSQYSSDWDIDPDATGADGDCWRGLQLALQTGIDKITTAGYGYRIAGVIWWQGESGGNATELNAFIAELRNHVKSEYLTDMVKERLPVVIAGTNNSTWGNDFEASVAHPDAYVGFVDTHESSGSQNGNVHPGSGANGLLTDGNGTGNNDMYDIGVMFAEKMVLARDGLTSTGNDEWTPAGLGAEFWFDASDESTITTDTDGTTVTAWNDKSLNANNPDILTGVSRTGTIGDKNAMTFNQNSVFRKQDDDFIFQEIYMVVENAGSAFSTWQGLFTGWKKYSIILEGDGTDGTRTNLYPNVHANANETLYHNGSTTPWSSQSNVDVISESINGGIIGVKTSNPLQLIGNQAGGENGWSIGQQSDFTDRGWNGKIAEVIAFPTALSDEQRFKLEGYLAHKWGLTAKLPTGHAYKLAKPLLPTTFTPAAIENKELWFDAADADAVVVDNNRVTQWTDKSGNNRHATQATQAKQATRGVDSLIFDGDGDGYTVLEPDGGPAIDAAPLSLYMIIKGNNFLTAYGDKDRLLAYGDSTGSANKGYYINAESSNGAAAVGMGGTSDAIINGQERYMLEYRKTVNGWHLRVNGTEVYADTKTGNMKFDSLGLKWAGTTSVPTFTGEMHEIVVVPSRDDRDKIEGYLAHKWDLESKLPNDHAYKDAAPTI